MWPAVTEPTDPELRPGVGTAREARHDSCPWGYRGVAGVGPRTRGWSDCSTHLSPGWTWAAGPLPQEGQIDRRLISNRTGFQARSRGGRWSRTLKLAQKRSWAGSWRWAAKVGLLSFRVVPQQQCNGHCPCDSAQHGSWNSNYAVH